MSTPLQIGPPVVAWRQAPAVRSRRRTLQIGASLLAIAATLSPTARAQTVVGPGATVTNSTTTTGRYLLSGDNGTLINQGTISPPSGVPVEARIFPFASNQLSSYLISGISLDNQGLITTPVTNIVTGIGIDGFSISNSGSIVGSGTNYPALYLNNVNNLQLSNTGLIGVDSPAIQSRVANLYKITNSTLSNQGTMAIMSVTDSLPALFVSAHSTNVSITNGGTISTVGGGQAILIGGASANTFPTTIDTTVVTEDPVATNITLNNTGVLSSNRLALTIGGNSSVVAVTNSGTITTTSAAGTNAISVQNAANRVNIANDGLIVNAGTGAAIEVSNSGTGVSIGNTGTITELAGNGIAIDHVGGTQPLAITNGGIINGSIRLSQPGDTLGITGGAINGAVIASSPGAGIVTFNAPAGFTTGGDFGSASDPLGGIVIVGGTLNVDNTLTANSVTVGPVAKNIALNIAGALSSNNVALAVGGFSSAVTVNNSGTITTGSATGGNAITISGSASQVRIANGGLVLNAGTGSAIDISTSGAGANVGNTGTITEIAGNGIAIDHVNGTAPLAITTGGVINGGVRLSQPGDTLVITGGTINGAVAASKPGAGTVTFNTPGAFTTGGDYGSASNPLGAVVIASGTLINDNTVASNGITVSGTTGQVAIANGGTVVNTGTGSAIDVSTTGAGAVIGNTGTITALTGNGIAIDHVAGTQALAITNSGVITGSIRLSQPGDTLNITGGLINGVTASTPGAGTVTINAPGGFTIGGNFGTAASPLGAIAIDGGSLINSQNLVANSISVSGVTGAVNVVSGGLLMSTASAIEVSTTGAGVGIDNVGGTITGPGGSGIAVDHVNGTQPMQISTDGVINGGVRLSQPGDTLTISGGVINGAVTASNPGAGTVTFDAPGGFTTTNNFGTASNPLGGIVIRGGTLNNGSTLVANSIGLAPLANGVTVNNTGVMSSNNVALAIGGTSFAVTVSNGGTMTTSATGANAVAVSNAARGVSIANTGLVTNAGTGAAIDVSTTGSGVTIGNTGTIFEVAGNGIAIDHLNGTTPLAITNGGTINGGVRFSQPGDTLLITGGAINGAVTASNAGAGTVTFNARGGFTTGGNYGSAGLPLGAIVIGGGNLTNRNSLTANAITVAPTATDVNLNNFGNLSSSNMALAIGGTASGIAVISSGTITTTSASGTNAIAVSGAARQVSIVTGGLVSNAGTGSAIDIATTGTGVTLENQGTITELAGNGLAIDHANGTTPLAITSSGIINGGIRLSQPGDTLAITGGAINGAVAASNPGAGTVTFNVSGAFTTGGDFGTASNPLGAIVISADTLINGNMLSANTITLGPTGTLNNTGVLSSPNVALAIGGASPGVTVTNSGTITTTAASGSNAIAMSSPVSDISVANSGLVVNAGAGAAIDVAGGGAVAVINNTGTISEVAGNAVAIDHANGTGQLSITNSGIINGNIRLSLPLDTLTITGGAINGAIVASNPGAGIVTFNAPGGFTTGGDIGSTSNPIGALVIAGGGLTNNNLITANSITLAPSATNVTLNNSGLLASGNLGLVIGGAGPAAVTVINTGAILTSAASGRNAISVSGSAGGVSIANIGLVENVGTGSAIDVSAVGASVTIDNTGTISELTGNGIAIDHSAPGLGGQPLGPTMTINTSGIINGGIRLSQPGDMLNIAGGAINGAVVAKNPGAGIVTFNAPGGFTTGGDFGTAGNPLGAVVVAGGALNLGNALWANAVTFGAGSVTTLLGTVNAVAGNGRLNFAGGTLTLGTNALVLGANATIRTSTIDGSSINLTIAGGQNGMINARAGNATVDTSANTLVIRPNLSGVVLKPGAQYAVIATSTGANVSNALTKLSVAPGPAAALFSVGTATGSTDAYGNALTPGKDIVLTVTGNNATVTNAALAANNQQIEQTQVNAVVTGITERIGDAVANAIAGSIGTAAPGGIAGGDEPGHAWTVWADGSTSYLSDSGTGRAFNGSIWTGLVGVDQPVTDNIILGVVAGGEENSFKLSSFGGRRSATGISVTPYAAYILNTWSAVDVELSYARLDNHVTASAGSAITNHYATNRVFAAANYSAYWNIDALTLRGKVGFLIANTGGPRYTDNSGVRSTPPSTTLQEAKLGGEASYHFEQFEPYLNLTASDDLRGAGGINGSVTGLKNPSRFGLQYDAGLRYKTEGGIQVGLHAGGETLRGSQSTFMGGLFARIPL